MYESEGSTVSPAIMRIEDAEKHVAELREHFSKLREQLSPILSVHPRSEAHKEKESSGDMSPISPLAKRQMALLRSLILCIQDVRELIEDLDL